MMELKNCKSFVIVKGNQPLKLVPTEVTELAKNEKIKKTSKKHFFLT